MKALATQLNPYHQAIGSLTAFDFRTFPTFSHVEKTIDSDKRGWDAYVFFKSGIVVNVHCKGYRVTINGKEFTAGNINHEVALSAGEPTSWSNMRLQFPHLVSLYTPNH